MRGTVPTRRLIALAAAYLVALQALLLPLSVVGGAASAATLCVTAAGHTQVPAGFDTGGGCAAGCGMQCCTPAMAGSPQVEFAFVARPADAVVTAPVRAPSFRPAATGPHTARAPPAV